MILFLCFFWNLIKLEIWEVYYYILNYKYIKIYYINLKLIYKIFKNYIPNHAQYQ
jgi:hypothetical protein